jgi:hypothetical protein
LSNAVTRAITSKYGQGVGAGLVGAYQPGGMANDSTTAQMLGIKGATPGFQNGLASVQGGNMSYGGQQYQLTNPEAQSPMGWAQKLIQQQGGIDQANKYLANGG